MEVKEELQGEEPVAPWGVPQRRTRNNKRTDKFILKEGIVGRYG